MKRYLLIIALFLFASCVDQVFEETPLDRFSDETVWSDLDLVGQFQNEVYNGVDNWVTGGCAQSSMTDELYSNFNWCGERRVTHGTLTPDNSAGVGVNYNKGGDYVTGNQSGKWGYLYKKIRAINLFFSRIDGVPGDESTKDRMKGEMYFLRAYFYAQLVNYYGGVPLVTKVLELNSDFIVPKSTYEECIDYIVAQADSAIALLPATYGSDDIGRATKGAAMAVKATQLLYAASPLYNGGQYDVQKLQRAKTATETLIDLGVYNLYSPEDYRNIFLDYNNPEVIFAKYTPSDFFIDRDNTISRDLGINSIHGYAAYDPLQQIVDQFEVTDGTRCVVPATYNQTGRVVTTDPLYNDQNPYVNRDPRFYANILFDGALYKGNNVVETYVGGKDSPQALSEGWNASKSGYYLRKFTTEKFDVFPDPPTEEYMWIIYRLSEFYLNEAEILNELGTTDPQGHDAAWYVNQIRQRGCVNMPPYASVDRETIRHERRVELCFEGDRYYDVRRWQIYDQALGNFQMGITIEKQEDGTKAYTVFAVDNKVMFDPRIYYLPIPSAEVNKDTNLGQSPGW